MSSRMLMLLAAAGLLVVAGWIAGTSAQADPATLEVSIPLTTGWNLMSLPLEPVNKSILYQRPPAPGEPRVLDPDSVFYDAYMAGNSPENRLFRYEPGVGFWTYNPGLFPTEGWYEVGGCPPPPWTTPCQGEWWQGFYFLVEPPEGVTITYTAYPLPVGPMVRLMDISGSPTYWAWMMIGACARMPDDPYNPDVTTWPKTSMVTDMMWGQSTPPNQPTTWLPTSSCDGPDAWDSLYIGLPFFGRLELGGVYTVSPSQVVHCGAPVPCTGSDSLTPGAGYWMWVEDPAIWLRLQAGQWP